MNSYLAPRLQVALISGPFILLLGLIIAVRCLIWGGDWFPVFIQSLPMALTGAAIILGSDTATSMVIGLLNNVPFMNIPDLNGTWSVEQRSNWPRVKSLLDGAGGEVASTQELMPIRGELAIRMNAFRITGTYAVIDAQSGRPSSTGRSDIIAASLTQSDSTPRLAYTAEAEVDNPENTDSTRYHFSAVLKFKPGSEAVAKGHYSTDRNWHTGLNTAGEMVISKND